ncbi:MAG: PEP-CTERM sorting domain-containing protein [Planctomycetes bacterium]|nr:PEP-CTERM sorting domain-containing protein [Planctomycetota bacterium]
MRYLGIVATIAVCLAVGATAQATPQWYEFSFTGADVWNASAFDPAATSGASQDAPRKHHDVWNNSGITSTWAYSGTAAVDTNYQNKPPAPGDTGFPAWAASAAGQAYSIREFNLWGVNGANALNWGEKYLAVPNALDHGVSSWELLASPTGWTLSHIHGSSWYANNAYPYWIADDTAAGLTQANMNDFVFGFRVLIDNPETAFETDGSMRIWFGGDASYVDSGLYQDPGGFEGVLKLTPVPEPVTMAGLMLGIGGLARYVRRRQRV